MGLQHQFQRQVYSFFQLTHHAVIVFSGHHHLGKDPGGARMPGLQPAGVGNLRRIRNRGRAYHQLLRDLPVRDQDEVVVLWTESADGATTHLPVYQGELDAFREQTRAFQSVAGVAYQGAMEQVLLDGERALSVEGTWVTGDFFPLLGVVPEHGRMLVPADDVLGAEPVMVISHAFWHRYFGGQASAVGHRFERDGTHFTVVGVLPPGFRGLTGAAVGYLIQFWTKAIDYPINVGGRPDDSAPAFIPITFETAILFGALSTFFGLLWLCRLPRLWHPVFEVEGFERTTTDRFWLCVDRTDPCFSADSLMRKLEDLGALRIVPISDVPEASGHGRPEGGGSP
jgi:hypothetical protein